MTKLDKSFELDRNPSNYEASTHLFQRMKQRDFLEADIVTEAIEEGSVQRTDEDGVVLRHQWLRSTFEVVVAPKDKVIQTAYEVEA